MRRQKNGTCTYCGVVGGVTREHVVPHCLFSPMPEVGVLVVPVCKKCNGNDKAELDVYFRDRLILDSMVQNHPTVGRIRKGTYTRSVRRNLSRLTRSASAIATKRAITHRGVYRGDYTVVFANEECLKQEIEYIVRGLSFLKHGRRLDQSCFIDVLPIKQFDASAALSYFNQLEHRELAFKMGQDHEFLAFYVQPSGDEMRELWCLVFYKAIVCVAAVVDSSLRALFENEVRDEQAGVILTDLIR